MTRPHDYGFRASGSVQHLNPMNAPRPSREELERLLMAAPNREIWLEAKRQYLEETDA